MTMGVRRGGNEDLPPPPEIGTKKQKFLENVKSAVSFRLVGLILAMTSFFCRYDTHTAQKSVHCSGVMQSLNCSSVNLLLWLQMHVAKVGSELFYY